MTIEDARAMRKKQRANPPEWELRRCYYLIEIAAWEGFDEVVIPKSLWSDVAKQLREQGFYVCEYHRFGKISTIISGWANDN